MNFRSTLIKVSLGAGAVLAALALDIATVPTDRAGPGVVPVSSDQPNGSQSDGGQSKEGQANGGLPFSGLALSGAWAGGGKPLGQPQRLATSELTIERKGGKPTVFKVEVARTPEEHEIGMMFRKSIEPDTGMLFLFPEPRQASFWMYNTYIPLDLIFIKKDGRIESIAPNAKPHSLQPRQSRGAVVAVLEIAGGQSEELGIAEGDRVLHPGLTQR